MMDMEFNLMITHTFNDAATSADSHDYSMYATEDEEEVVTSSATETHFVWWLNKIIMPTVIVVGLTANTWGLIVICITPHLRRTSTNIYLAFLSAVDNVFLLTLLVGWLAWLNINIANRWVAGVW